MFLANVIDKRLIMERDFKEGDSYQVAVPSVQITGVTFPEYIESLRQAMNNGENSGLKENQEHFPIEERGGLKPNEKFRMDDQLMQL